MGEAEPRRSEGGALSTRRLQLRPLRQQDGVVLAELAAAHAVRRDLSLALFAVAAGNDGESFVVLRQADRTVVGSRCGSGPPNGAAATARRPPRP